MTVRQHFQRTMNEYTAIVNSSLSSTDAEYQRAVRACIESMHTFWTHMNDCGVFSANEELADISTPTLSMLTAPYVIGDLHLRIVDDKIPREKLIDFARAYFAKFLALMVNLELLTEKEVEMGVAPNPSNRTARIELSRAQSALRAQIEKFDSRIGFLRARTARMRRLEREESRADDDGDAPRKSNVGDGNDDGSDSDGEGDGADEGCEIEELLRERALAHLKWCIGDTFSQSQSAAREAEMLALIPPERRAEIAAEYQEGIKLMQARGNDVGRSTYVILPGGQIATTEGDGRTLLRQRVKEEAFINRIQPTMTLEEFAQQEMAFVMEQEQRQREGQQAQAEEDERLGPEGVEERERQKQAAWDDWRDNNPPIGITAKGNYS